VNVLGFPAARDKVIESAKYDGVPESRPFAIVRYQAAS
jgi:hypothetical protein